METDCLDPDIKQECAITCLTTSNLCRWGLTQRNISQEKRSRNIEVKYQQKNCVEKAIHHYMNSKAATSPNEIDMNVSEYANDKVETYANIINRKLTRS